MSNGKWTIFGREPALVVGFIGAGLSVLAAFSLSGLSTEQVTLIVAALGAVTGAVTAALTRPVAPGAFTALVAAVAALAAGYGLEVGPEVVGSVNGLVLAFLALVTRGEVSPSGAVDPAVLGSGRR